MRQIFLMMIGLSVGLIAGLSKSGNIVTDSQTRLQWQDDAIGTTMPWEPSITHCENLSLDGYSDWRLPNLRELTSLIDDSKVAPSIDTSVFEHTASYYYWSSTTYAGATSRAWYVYFNDGYQRRSTKSASYYVRCVRAGQ